MEHLTVTALLGKTLTNVEKSADNERIIFDADTGERFELYHEQNCCESVCVEDIVGDLNDLVGSPITLADEATSNDRPANLPALEYEVESQTWTFYRFATVKGYVNIRFYGTSNGYYSESVSFARTRVRRSPPMRDTSSPSSDRFPREFYEVGSKPAPASIAGTPEQTRLMFATLGGGVEVVPVASVVSVELPGHAPDCVRLEFMPSEPGEPAWLHRGEVQQLRDYLNAMLSQWPTESDIAAFLDAPDDAKVWRPAEPQPLLMVDNFPRRNRMDHWSDGERTIQRAVDAVERMGADTALTDAVVLLGKAKDRVADFVDAKIRAGSATPASSAEPEGVTPSFDDAYRRLDSFATGGPDPDVEMLRRDVFALLERFDRHTPKSAQSKHVCGLQGFGALDDVCEACNENAAARLAQRSASPASETATTARPCTCHPADNPPRPCAEKYALSDCRPSADPSVTTDAETVNLPGWCLYCGGTYRTFAPGLAGCDNRECVRHPYINEANAAKKAAAWRGTPESSPAVDADTAQTVRLLERATALLKDQAMSYEDRVRNDAYPDSPRVRKNRARAKEYGDAASALHNLTDMVRIAGGIPVAGSTSAPAVDAGTTDTPECTGIAAHWCPRCGHCTCDREEQHARHDCPLHGDQSRHADEPTRSPESTPPASETRAEDRRDA